MHVFIITQLEQNHSYIHCFSKDLFAAMAFFPVAIVICKLIYKNSRNRCCSTTYTLNHLKQLKLRLWGRRLFSTTADNASIFNLLTRRSKS